MKKDKKETMTFGIAAVIISVVTVLLYSSCSVDTDDTPPCSNPLDEKSGRVINYTDCKNTGGIINGEVLPSDECITFNYYPNNELLQMTHINAGFNCCPEKISAIIIFENNNIKITEKQAKAGCKCECLYDVNYEFRNIKPGVYHIEIFGPITDGKNIAPLTFDFHI